MDYRLLTDKQQCALAEILNHLRPCLIEEDIYVEGAAADVLMQNLPALPYWLERDIVVQLLCGNQTGIDSILQDYAKMEVAA